MGARGVTYAHIQGIFVRYLWYLAQVAATFIDNNPVSAVAHDNTTRCWC
jgi:hypothetical protein